MPTTLTNGIQLPDKGSVDWYGSMQSNYNLIDTHLGNTDIHVTAEDKANWDSKQGSLSQTQLDAIAQVSTNTNDIATLQSDKANVSHTHSSSDITDIGDYATKQYVDNSISGLVDSAPNALDTLNELAAALNDDANFASTVTTALSAKANSVDLATVATSGSYNDLSNKPTINDSTITIQKNGSLVGTFTVNGSAKTIDIPVPTKTSDLINDSNFVDTSNSAVASGITSAKVTDYDTHIANTNIHVTTADKTKWNNGVSQSYVLRYSSSSVTDNSTIAYSTLDNTDNIKAGDKVIDVDGKIFSVVSVDTTNQTVTVGSALIDLALDANVVHTSGVETVGGFKQFANIRVTNSIKGINLDSTTTDLNNCYSDFASYGESKGGNIQYYYCNTDAGTANISNLPETKAFFLISITTRLISNSLYVKQILINSNNKTYTRYCSNSTWGSWVNETDKYVTTDMAQTVSGAKTFSSNVNVYNSDSTGNVSNIVLKNSKAEVGTEFAEQSINFVDKNNSPLATISCYGSSGNYTRLYITASASNNNSEGIFIRKSITGIAILPTISSTVWMGNSTSPFYNVHTKRINGLTPSSLGMPVAPSSTSYVDISSYITVLDSSSANKYTPPSNGYITFHVKGNQVQFMHDYGLQAKWSVASGNVNRGFIPVLGGVEIDIYVSATDIYKFWFIPCQGNV